VLAPIASVGGSSTIIESTRRRIETVSNDMSPATARYASRRSGTMPRETSAYRPTNSSSAA
jgi:hypothetical protein